jgi:hypothetical protein
MTRPVCPKCGKTMTLGSKAQSGKQRYVCVMRTNGTRIYCYSTTDATATVSKTRAGNAGGKPSIFKRPIRQGVQTFIITAAQNATPIHEDFWACLQTARKALDAELLVVPLRYKNPTSRWTASQANEEIWDVAVRNYLYNTRLRLNKNLVLLGDIKTQPTATNPVEGFESITGGESAILAHTRLQLRSVATPANKMAKIVTTTGACTVANYTDSKAGKKGEFHHALAAIIVEIDSGIFHMRHVHYDTKSKSFTDLETRYTVGGVVRAPRPLALVMGDTHVDFVDPEVVEATDEMIAMLEPELLVWHDLLDGYSCNPHHIGNPFNAAAKRDSGMGDVKAEVMRAIEHVRAKTPDDCVSVVVSSNHDNFLGRWIINNDWREIDPINHDFYLETALMMRRGTKMGTGGTQTPNPFKYWLERELKDNDKFDCLGGDESYVAGGVELSLHGDRGPNGARGSARNLRRIGVKTIVGHSHSPAIEEGCYQVGTSTRLRLEYNGGPSSWLNCHCLLHADGKRQLITIVGGKWRLM